MPYECITLGDTPPDCTDLLSRPSAADLLPSLLDHLPTGSPWQSGSWRQPLGSTTMHRFFRVVGAYLGDLYALAFKAAQASTVCTADPDCIEDWEYELGQPGPCMAPGENTEARRATLRLHLLSGGASPAYFVCLAGRFGFTIEIDHGWLPFEAGRAECGGYDGCRDDELHWIVTAARNGADRYFEAGLGEAGLTPLGERPIRRDLECLINHFKPAHTTVHFRYSDLTLGDSVTIDKSSVTIDQSSITSDAGVLYEEDPA